MILLHPVKDALAKCCDNLLLHVAVWSFPFHLPAVLQKLLDSAYLENNSLFDEYQLLLTRNIQHWINRVYFKNQWKLKIVHKKVCLCKLTLPLHCHPIRYIIICWVMIGQGCFHFYFNQWQKWWMIMMQKAAECTAITERNSEVLYLYAIMSTDCPTPLQ